MNERAHPSGAVARVLDRLRNVKSGANGWTALCPALAHEDRRNSLSVAMGDDGRVLIKCHAGCENETVVRALGLEWPDLFSRRIPSRAKREGGAKASPFNAATAQYLGCTLTQFAAAKRLPTDFLKALGLSEFHYMGAPAVRMPYVDAAGNEAAVRFRLALAKTEGIDDRFRWKSGAKPCLYGLWRISHAEFATLRLRLLKLGARVIETVSRVRLAFTAACPEADQFRRIAITLQRTGP